ncbi:hypothetical protein BD324DRAFT_614990 [Kockovaella imperatae]|uniref:SMP-30/Gluconolactonase/LRE-like region domain-containing protein n=1 Tax=Kockovaella imperatae TaxID=4999 RepID=A0A1Y1UP12_9TREE|nr:hypothetical protein BD324DRAFT_614990 [Kockovaella imperatae]ORX39790.1 hypothetical protein BD324DRAFT_614990 [Kockovaella imperatae]
MTGEKYTTVQDIPTAHHCVVQAPFLRHGTHDSSLRTKFDDRDDHEPFGKDQPSFISVHDSFKSQILGSSASIQVIAEDSKAFAHEAGVWVESTQEVWLTSNLYFDGQQNAKHPELQAKRAEISKLAIPSGKVTTRDDLLEHILTPNGGCPYGSYVLFCEQGAGPDRPSSFVLVDPKDSSKEPIVILNNFYGRHFNSLNDAVLLPPPKNVKLGSATTDNSSLPGGPPSGWTLWFTDPTYGHEQGFRQKPQMPSQVYCFDPQTSEVRAVADGFDHPNGLCFSPEGDVCYVTDTGSVHGNGDISHRRPATIYAFDVHWPDVDMTIGGPTLHNRRLFAFIDVGLPDGIKCDTAGNVYSGCGDGVHVWNKYGKHIGKIFLGTYCANFCFIPGGRMICLAEEKIFLVEGLQVEGALLEQKI